MFRSPKDHRQGVRQALLNIIILIVFGGAAEGTGTLHG